MTKRGAALTLLSVALLTGVTIALLRGWGGALVTARIENVSGEAIAAVTLQVETCGEQRNIPGGSLAADGTAQIEYTVCGEAGYTVEARFESGHSVAGGGGYVENGYRSTDRISRNGITSTQSTY